MGNPCKGIGHVLAFTVDQKEYGMQKQIQEESLNFKYEKPYATTHDGQCYATSFSTNIPYGFSY